MNNADAKPAEKEVILVPLSPDELSYIATCISAQHAVMDMNFDLVLSIRIRLQNLLHKQSDPNWPNILIKRLYSLYIKACPDAKVFFSYGDEELTQDEVEKRFNG